MDWTLDTGVLYQAADADFQATHLLLEIVHKRHNVAFDQEEYIVREYRECVRRTRSHLVRKWVEATMKLAVRFSGKLAHRHEEALSKLAFDRDDWPFVAVSSRTEDKRLVSEESDYAAEVREYLVREMGVAVLGVAESLRLFP